MANDPTDRGTIPGANPAQAEGDLAPSASSQLVEMVVVEDDGTRRAVRVVDALAAELAREPGRAYYATDPGTQAGQVWDELAHDQLIDAVEPVSAVQGVIDNAVSGAVSMGIQREFMDPLERAALEKFDEENPMLAGTARWGSFAAATALSLGGRAAASGAANTVRVGLHDLGARSAWRTAAALIPGGSASVAAGQAARRAAAKRMGVAPEAGTVAQRMGMRAAEFGVEGGLMEMQIAATDAMLEDTELSAEMILSRGATGALLGMGMGAAASAAGGAWRGVGKLREGRKSPAERLITEDVERVAATIPGPDANLGEVFESVMRMSDTEFDAWRASHKGSDEVLAQVVEARPALRAQLREGRQQLSDDMVEVLADIAEANRAARGMDGSAESSAFNQIVNPESPINRALETATPYTREQTVAMLREQSKGWLTKSVTGVDDAAQAAVADGGVSLRSAGYEHGLGAYADDMKALLGFEPKPGQYPDSMVAQAVDFIWEGVEKVRLPPKPTRPKVGRRPGKTKPAERAAWDAANGEQMGAYTRALDEWQNVIKPYADNMNALLGAAAKPVKRVKDSNNAPHTLLQQIYATAQRARGGGTKAEMFGELQNYARYRLPSTKGMGQSGFSLARNVRQSIDETMDGGLFGTKGPAMVREYAADLKRSIDLHEKIFKGLGGAKATGQTVRDNGEAVTRKFFAVGKEVPDQNLYVDLAELTRVNKKILTTQAKLGDARMGAPVLRAQELLSKNMQNLEYLNALNQLTFKRSVGRDYDSWTATLAQFVFGAGRGLAPPALRRLMAYWPTAAVGRLVARGIRRGGEMLGAGPSLQRTKGVAAQAVSDARSSLGNAVGRANEAIKGRVPGALPAVRVMGWSAVGSLAALPETKREKAYNELREQIEALAGAPEAMVQGMEVGTRGLIDVDPSLAQSLSLGASKGLYTMLDAIPDHKKLNPMSGQPDRASPEQQKHFLRVVQAVNRPETLADEVAQGFVHESTLQTVRHVYPQTYALLITSMSATARKEKSVPYYTRLLLGDLTGMNFDATQEAAFISAMDRDYTQTPEQSAAMGQVAAMQAQGNAQAVAYQQAARRLPGSTASTAQKHRSDLERLANT